MTTLKDVSPAQKAKGPAKPAQVTAMPVSTAIKSAATAPKAAAQAPATAPTNVVPVPIRPPAASAVKSATKPQAAKPVARAGGASRSASTAKEPKMTKASATAKKATGGKANGSTEFPFAFPAFKTLFPGFETLSAMPTFPTFPTFPSLPAFKGYEGLAEMGAENLKAAIAASTAMVKAMDVLTKQMAAFATDSFSASFSAAKELSECRSIGDVFEQQTIFTRTLLDRVVEESAKLSRLSVDAAKDAFVPLNARVEEATEKFVKTMAA
ncbi:MAG: phasin family protein [Alphaproteobacteria bacterium]